ncbi:MFS transporter [Ralstonia soli]|uniref:MFS transporter n=1 Tax=Ralstonia soli TaxID=2953896 RepID=A0ABT1ANN5_9RALS|nr:MFS transporter [Ralstonia soli]MCO5399707.1 MFS transporter [Ralstonia soli]
MQESRAARSVWTQWGLVVTLTVITMLAQIDKNILVLMVGPIQREFGVGDVQVSFLIGAAFAVANIVVGMPAGWLADRFDRRVIIASGVLIWSVAVAANAAMASFIGLVAARIIVGGAEALIPPSSYSLIRDGIDDTRRARALSVYTMALILGTGLSLVLGGPMMGAIQAANWHALPVIGHVAPWQMTLFLIGMLGFPIGLLIFLNVDPGRSGSDASADAAHRGEGLRDIAHLLWKQRSLFGPLLLFVIANAVITYGLAAWMPTVAARRFALDMKVFGLTQGALMLTAGPLGLWLAGIAMQRKKVPAPLPRVAWIGLFASFAVAVLTVSLVLATSLRAFWIADAMVVLCSWTFMSVTSVIVARTAPTQSVGLVMAIVLVLNGLIGQGFSPTLIALVGRHLFNGAAQALPNAMAVVFAVAGLLACVAATALRRELRRNGNLSTAAQISVSV